jgi:hypothetical protein
MARDKVDESFHDSYPLIHETLNVVEHAQACAE